MKMAGLLTLQRPMEMLDVSGINEGAAVFL